MPDSANSAQAPPPVPQASPKPQTPHTPSPALQKQTPSIANVFKKERTADAADEKSPAIKENQAVSAAQVREKIAHYLAVHQVSGALKNTLSKPIDLKANAITLTLVNAVEKPLIQNMEAHLLTFLRKELQNDSLYFEYHAAAPKEESKPTHTEIFQAMTHKNPRLLKLKEAFGLDLAH